MPRPEQHVSKLQLYPSARSSVEWAEVEPAVRNTSFFSATVEDYRILSLVQGLVATGLEQGLSIAEFVYQAEQALDMLSVAAYGDKGEHFDKSLATVNEYNRLRLIFRTQGELAHGYRQFCEAFNPIDLKIYPGWRFMRMPGAKESQKRKDHVDHEGVVRLKTDIDFWLDRNRFEIGGFGNPYGPWGFNSWMYCEPVEREECEALGLLRPGEKVTPPPELSEWNLPDVLQQMGTASTRGIDRDAVKGIIDRCKKEEGFTVQWTEEDETLQIVPKQNEPLGALSDATFDEWLNENLDDLFAWSEEEEATQDLQN